MREPEEKGKDISRFSVAVRAESIQRALRIAGERYPGSNVRVEFPIDPESFFVKDLAIRAERIEFEAPEKIAV